MYGYILCAQILVRSDRVKGLAGEEEADVGVDEEIIYTVRNLFGQFEQTLHVFARSLAERLLVAKHCVDKALLVSVGVKRDHLERIDLFKHYESEILASLQASKSNTNARKEQ